MSNVSVVIPYYNEINFISRTFELITNQSFRPKEIFFINSNSSDESFAKVNSLIKHYKGSIQIYNINTDCSTPSGAKNIGVNKCSYEYIAFMDCDMHFNNDWLFNQITFIKNSSYPIVLGQVILEGTNLVDKCSVIHTYGYNKLRPCVPSSMVKKEFLDSNGLFEELNALYDQKWIRSNLKNGKAITNKKIIIKYFNTNYASNLLELYNKVYYYSIPTIRAYGVLNKELLLLLIFILLSIFNPSSIIYIGFIYLILRNLLLTVLKSKNLKIFKLISFRFDMLIITSIVIDIAKLTGTISGIFKKKISHYQR